MVFKSELAAKICEKTKKKIYLKFLSKLKIAVMNRLPDRIGLVLPGLSGNESAISYDNFNFLHILCN